MNREIIETLRVILQGLSLQNKILLNNLRLMYTENVTEN